MNYSSYQICLCSFHIINILMEYFIKYKFKIECIIHDITDYKQHIYSIDSELHERLHILWLGYFYELYVQPDSLYGIMWIFSPLNDNSQIIKTNLIWSKKIPAKFRFHCSYCNHIWTSKKGYINIFIGHRPLNRIIDQSGYIINIYEFLFSLDQQKCTQCNSNKLISGSTYPHEVIKVLAYIRNYITIKPIYFSTTQYGFQIEFFKNSFTFNQQKSINKETINSQIVSNSNGETFKEICSTKNDQSFDSLKKSSEISKFIKNSKNYPFNEESIKCNHRTLSITEGKSTVQLLKDNNREVIMTKNKLNNINKNDTDLYLNKEPVSLKCIPKPTELESTTVDDLKQTGNQINKMSIRGSCYV
ncbi:unnamed protein product [Schistosoma haematobium]|nr:unnamed protein product [Schistosoma haematobium]CAH8681618.1 unnamed protein product [Schistosoma haematobium]